MTERVTIPKLTMTPTETAASCNLRERQIIRLAELGELPCIRVGKQYLFLPEEVAAWLARRSMTTTATSDILSDDRQDTTRPDTRLQGTTPPPIPLKRGPRGKKLLP